MPKPNASFGTQENLELGDRRTTLGDPLIKNVSGSGNCNRAAIGTVRNRNLLSQDPVLAPILRPATIYWVYFSLSC